MSQPEHYEMLVLGSGEGGKYLAWHMAKAGHRTAVVERKLIGGSCPNTNCLPSKNEIWSAKVADLVHHADRFGSITTPSSTDMSSPWFKPRCWRTCPTPGCATRSSRIRPWRKASARCS
jgi:pyruvate/2-oxoglutarate dehydrogenase complex dihydrolipoamide dehydrogenase (E3) component